MNKKAIILIICLICIALSFSTATAADAGESDANETLSVSVSESVDTNDNLTSTSIEVDDNLQAGSGGGSFSDLDALLHNRANEYKLTQNYTYNPETDSAFLNGISITSSITIDGDGYTIDGNGQARIFDINAPNIILKNIRFINGYSTQSGGAIYVEGDDTLEIINCNFMNNTAGVHGGAIYLENSNASKITSCYFANNTAGVNGGAVDWHKGATHGELIGSNFVNNTAKRSGGAVFWYGVDGDIKDSNFTNNKALGIAMGQSTYGYYSTGGDGGAVMWTGHNGDIINSRFIGNNASRRGGAVFMQGASDENCDNLTIDLSTFEDNYAGVNGGAVDWYRGAHYGKLYNSTFKNNTAMRSGGAVYWYGTDGEIRNVSFTDNKAYGIVDAPSSYGYNTTGGDGGAVMWTGSNGVVDNSTFINNWAAARGGAVFLQGSVEGNCTNTTFTNSYFRSNTAETNGGAIDWYEGAHDGIVDNLTFIDNTAKRNGGAIFWHGINGIIRNSNFINNRATGEALQYNMTLSYSDIILINSNVLPTNMEKGKLYVLNYTENGLRVFKSYTLNDTNEPVLLDETTTDALTISPVDWAIDQFLGGDGGSILWSGNIGLVENCNFTESNSARRGGAAYMTGSDYVTYNNCNFINTTSGTNGGGVDWLAGANYGKIYNCVFNNTRAARSAGAIYYDGWYGEMKNITIINATAYGGSLKTSRDGKVKYAGWDSSHWDTNTTGGDGGAIMFTGDHEYIYNVTFINCTAQGRGGAVFLQDNENVTFDLCKFIGCEALGIATNTWDDYKAEYDGSGYNYKLTGHGGAIAFDIGAHDSTIKNSEFTFNYARRDGGAINIADDSYNFTIENTKFTNNSAGDDGGAINWVGDLGFVNNITCYNNTGDARADDVTGKSTSLGGTMCIEGHNVTVTKSSFTLSKIVFNDGNLSKTNGGAIAISGENTTISHSTFDRCTSPNNAGAVSIIGDHTTIINCTFENCNATEDGGAIEVNGTDCKLYNSTFNNNFAGDDGGAINWIGSNGYVYNITCNDNEGIGFNDSHSVGGTISLAGDNITVNKSTFEQSFAIVAGGALYVRGNNINIVYSSFNDCNVYLNISSTGKQYANGGGAIYVLGNDAIISNCNFTNSEARAGGAIYVDGKNTFIDTINVENTYSNVEGGAIYIGNGKSTSGYNTTILNSKFKNTLANTSGGAIYINGALTNISGSTFEYVHSVTQGGAIYIKGANAIISSSNFTTCGVTNSSMDGGAIYINGVSTTIFASDFKDCQSTRNGGAIYVTGANAHVNGNFTSCTSNTNGGAIYVTGANTYIEGNFTRCTSGTGGAVYLSGNNAIINASSFDGNDATSNGGALYSNGYASKVYNSNFTNNKKSRVGQGGAIYWVGGHEDDTIDGCYFENNQAVDGGAIYWNYKSGSDAKGTIANSKFISNRAWDQNKKQGKGGAIAWAAASDANIIGCYFDDNLAIKHGGAIYAGVDSSLAGKKFRITNSTFENNNCTLGPGGAVTMRTANSEITGCVFRGNWASYAGAIELKENPWSNALIDNCTFIDSVAFNNPACSELGSGGGAISTFTKDPWHGTGTQTNLTLINSRFINCTSKVQGGGAIDWFSDEGFMENVTFINCSAPSGGAIRLAGNNNKFNNITFVNCSASTGNGGAIELGLFKVKSGTYTPSNCELTNITVINSTAAGDGGAILISYSSITFDNVTVIKSSATNGGAIAFDSASSNNNVIKAHIYNSIASNNGGAIYGTGQNNIVSNSTFKNNSAINGGAIYNYAVNNNDDEKNNPFIIQYSSFVENTAENEGGAIYLGYYGGEIIRCDFTDNTAYNGGAVVIANNYQKVYYCNFEGNNATMYGGSIYVKSVVNGYIENSTFKHSHAHDGGAIYNVGMATVAVYIINDTFIKNTATHNGGAVYYTMYNSANFKFVYRDYNNFDGRGTPVDGDRTTVTFQYASQTWGDVIVHSYFEENEDYLLNITAELDTNVAIVSLNDPKEYDKNNVKITLTLTYNGVENQTIEINSINYDELFHNGKYNFYDLSIGDYVVYMTFEVDGEYMVKTANYTFNVSEISDIGDFEYIQRLIELKINSSSVDEDVITVVLPRDFAHNRLDREHDKGCINITNVGKPIIITGGNGVVTINAKEACRIFNITASNVTLVNIELFNGNASGQYSADHVDIGGGIYCSGANLTLTNVIFRHNNANIGGGLYLSNSAGNCKIDGCEFISNVAVENGGAIDCNSPNMYLTNTLFESNTADTGAALCREVNASGGSGYNNTFKFNHALTNGSALAWINASRISIDTYFFYNNDAGNSGGAIFVGKGSGNCEIKNCVFKNNKVLSFDNGHGGAIEWYASEGLVINSSFTGNKAFEGGAIYVGFGSDDIDIINSNFTDNQAYHYGGAISIEASSITINQSNFNDNLALSGGALYVGGEGTTNIVRLSSFTGNNATDGNGGAINWVASSGQIYDTNFTKNYGSYGGGIYLGGLSTESSIIRCIFEENYADYNGGAIDCNTSKMVLNHTVFKYNYAQYGAALCREAEATGGKGINNTFISNHAYIGGAALGWMKSQNITIRNYTFINNTANVYGGAIYVGPNSHNCNIYNSTFDQNHITDSYRVDEGKMDYFTPYGKYVQIYLADYGLNEDLFGLGGAVYFAASNGTVVNSNFTNNNASNGGAIYVASDSGNTLINSSTFGNNYASLCGGAINLNASAAHIYGTIFNDNVAVNGSALYVGGVGTHNTIYRSVFERNNASSYGAGIYWIAAAGEIDECNFTSNSAVYGGGIYLNGRSSNTNITNSIFKLNNATKNGGAIECNAQNIGIYNLTFDNNYAGEYGAALCREQGATHGHGNHTNFTNNHAGIAGAALAWMNVKNINIDYYNFINNTADFSGGAIYVADGSDNCTINHCYFEANGITNTTGGHGGAIDIIGNGSQIINSEFIVNYAFYGGAIFAGNQSGNTNIQNVTFKENTADVNGGAIQITGSGVTLNDTRFYSNIAGESGGAVYVSGEGTTNSVYYSVFDNNKAGDHGGAINWLAYSGEVYYSNFTNNEAIYGGAIYLNRISSDSKIVNVRFENNSAVKNGGAIDCNSSSMGLNNTRFITNYAGEYGAALCREADATHGFGGNNTFIGNQAGISGAALAWLGVTGINIYNYTFINNTAYKSGGAIFVRGDSPDCKVRNSHFDNNYVTDVRDGQGGAIDWLGDNGYIFNTTFKNSLALNGGTLYVGVDSNNMQIIETLFEGSHALAEGGSIVLLGDNVTISKSNFTYSIGLTQGGAISAHDSYNTTIVDCYFLHDVGAGYVSPTGTAFGDGGAIFWENANNLNITNTRFEDIEAHGMGTIVAINCNDSVINNVTFKGIFALSNGGCIAWINSTNLTISSSKFLDAGASYNGGAVFLNNTNAVIEDSLFNNTSTPWVTVEYCMLQVMLPLIILQH